MLIWITADDVSMVADQRTLVILERVEVSGQLTVVDRENKPAVEGLGKLARPVLHGQVHLAAIPFGKGRGAVKLAPLRPRSGGERGAVKLAPLRPRSGGERGAVKLAPLRPRSGGGRGAVKLAPRRPRSGGERGAVKLAPLRRRSRGEQA